MAVFLKKIKRRSFAWKFFGAAITAPGDTDPMVMPLLRTRLVIKTFEKDSRPRPRPWSPGLETKSKTLGNRSRDQDQDLGQQVSRPRPRPWSPGLETKTKTLVIR